MGCEVKRVEDFLSCRVHCTVSSECKLFDRIVSSIDYLVSAFAGVTAEGELSKSSPKSSSVEFFPWQLFDL